MKIIKIIRNIVLFLIVGVIATGAFFVLTYLVLSILGASLSVGSPKCPDLKPETKPVFQETMIIKIKTGEGRKITVDNNYFTNLSDATITIENITKKFEKVNEEPDLEAIEYNKKVRECQIANGEF